MVVLPDERLEPLLEALEGLVVLVGPDGRILAANPAYRDAFGAAGQPGALCPGWPGDAEATLGHADACPVWAALASGREFRAHQTRHLADGASRLMEVMARPVRDGRGVVACAVEVSRDVTERRALEADVMQAQKMEALCTLAGGIAHDFNNILFGMLGFAELVRMDLPPASPAEANLRQLVRSIERARGLVAQIQAFSRRTDATFAPVDLGRLLEDQRDLLGSALPAPLDFRVSAAPGVIVEGSAAELAQLLANLGTNAAQSMPRGGLLEMTLAPFDVDEDFAATHPGLRAGPYALVAVSDTGTGIAPDLLERVFEPFFTTRELGQGNGMGLAVAHGIATGHGGVITAHSEAGRGSTFRVYLPRIGDDPGGAAAGDPDAIAGGAAAHDPDAIAGGAAGGLADGATGRGRVLLVDADPLEAEACRRGLVRRGLRVVARTTPTEALAVLRAAPLDFDVVVAAETLPGMDGVDLALLSRQVVPGLPVVLTTGLGLEAARARLGGRVPGAALLQKPVATRELARTIRSLSETGDER